MQATDLLLDVSTVGEVMVLLAAAVGVLLRSRRAARCGPALSGGASSSGAAASQV